MSGNLGGVSLPDDARLRPVADVSARVLDQDGGAGAAIGAGDRAVLVNLRNGQCWELNRLGHEIWQLLATPGGASVSEIVATLARRYPVPLDTLRADVIALAETLRREGLLAASDPP